MIDAKIVKHSINKGSELLTFELIVPRFLLPELEKHRVTSLSVSSNRAVPLSKNIEMVKENPFIPYAFQKKHKGMQGTEYITDEKEKQLCVAEWLKARDFAVEEAIKMDNLGVSKQICNRLLEPFMWSKCLLTIESSVFFNMVDLRKFIFKFKNGNSEYTFFHREEYKKEFKIKSFVEDKFKTLEDWLLTNIGQAEIHFSILIEKMLQAFEVSYPNSLKEEQWHIPYEEEIKALYPNSTLEERIKISISMAARTSYTIIQGNKNLSKEDQLNLFELLKTEKHLVPMEHVARAMNEEEFDRFSRNDGEKGWCATKRGFVDYRYIVENEKN